MNRTFTLLALACLGACTLTAPVPLPGAAAAPPPADQAAAVQEALAETAAEEAPPPAALPYPEPGLQEQIAALQAEIARLSSQAEQLAARLERLEKRQPAPRSRPQQQPRANGKTAAAPDAAEDGFAQAQSAYRQGRYAEAVRLLAASANGGSGSESDRQKMQLLLDSQERLGNCQSVIQTGRRYAELFAGHSGAAQALYSVGRCQWQIQQRDIARDTWRTLIRRYPQSPAAREAETRLRQ